jgi:hypothetical protein
MFARLQREEESLSAYSNAVKKAAQVLRLSLSEAEIVANIVDGLSKTQRSRLIFKNSPVTFRDVEELRVHDQNVSFNDNVMLRDGHTHKQTKHTPTSRLSVSSNAISSAGNRHRDVLHGKWCFRCHQEGCLMNTCRNKLADFRRQERDHQLHRLDQSEECLMLKRECVVNVPPFESPQVPVQIGHLTFLGLLDTGVVRSFISYDHLVKLQQQDPELRIADSRTEYESASGHHLEIVGEVDFSVKVHGSSCKFPFVVVKDLARGLRLGIDFMGKTGLVLDVLTQEYYFHSDVGARFKLSPPVSSGFETQEIQNMEHTQNVMADSLSCLFETCPEEKREILCCNVFTKFPFVFGDLAIAQRQDAELAQIIQRLEAGDNCHPYSLHKKVLHCRSCSDGKLKVVVPMATVPMVFEFFHNSVLGRHLWVFKRINKVCAHFIWKGMANDIGARVQACRTCALAKSAQKIQEV